MSDSSAPAWDVVIVGAGSAGCVLAAELSREPGRRVLVIESGPAYPPDRLPDDVAWLTHPYEPHHLWGDQAESGSQRIPYARGRLVGGSSAINNTMAFRPVPADVDGWAVDGWGWADLLPHFVAIEHDLDVAAPWHGTDGPLPIVRYRDDELADLQRWFRDRCLELGYPWEPDFNDPGTTGGIGAIPMNRDGARRVSAADAWLHPALERPNLGLRAGCDVERIAIEGGRAIGVMVDGELVRAGEVVVAAGVIGSPALLARSGVAHPDLGTHLSDHPSAPVRLRPVDPDGFAVPTPVAPVQVLLRAEGLDTMVFALPSGTVMASPQGVATTGRVLPTSDGGARIDWSFLGDPACRADLRRAVRMAADIAGDRRQADVDLADDDALDAYVNRWHRSFVHGCGTCGLGRVVDPELRVEGVDGLRVGDASVVPVVPRANPNLTVLAVAHRAAAIVSR